MQLQDKRILVTGGNGFLGKHVVGLLREQGCTQLFCPSRREFDLSHEENVGKLFQRYEPEVVVHLAGVVSGIGGNRRHPGTLAYKNLVMGAHLIEYARLFRVQKFLMTGTICSYPKITSVPFREEDLWHGYPEETNAPYGLAKKMLMVQMQAYRQEFGFNGVNLLLVNLFGPGDNFDLENSHVIPALIRKCVEAEEKGRDCIEVWGSGRATREFLYVKDAARAIWLALQHYDSPKPINIGTGREICIADLVKLIAKKTGFRGAIRFNADKPDGQPRRCLDVSRAKQLLNFSAETTLEDGLDETIDWYRHDRKLAAMRLPAIPVGVR